MRAIETRYKGYRFRSRLEARWAVFLDAMGAQWDYEPEGFTDGDVRYLPDFLVEGMLWIEVKPHADLIDERDRQKWRRTVRATRHPLLVVFGMPRAEADVLGYPVARPTTGGVLYRCEDGEDVFAQTANVCECRRCGGLAVASHWQDFFMLLCPPSCTTERWPVLGEHVREAALAARAARFEFGEGGR